MALATACGAPGCGHAGPAPSRVVPTGASTAPLASPSTASATPDDASAPAAAPSLHVAVQGDAPQAIVAGDGGGLVLTARSVVEFDGPRARVVRDPFGTFRWLSLGKVDVPPPPYLSAAGGHWPDGVVLTTEGPYGGGAYASSTYRWTDHRWAEFPLVGEEYGDLSPGGVRPYRTYTAGLPVFATFAAFASWASGAVLGVANENSLGMLYEGVSFHSTPTLARRPIPAAVGPGTPPAGGTASEGLCVSRMGEASALATLPEGEVFVAGSECSTDAPAVEAWGPGETAGHFTRLPPSSHGGPNRVLAIAAVSPSEVYVGGARAGFSYMAVFDGKQWKAVEPVMRLAISSMAASPAGPVWATTTDGELWRKPPGADWARVDLAGRRARSVVVGDRGDAWVLCPDAVLRSAPTESVTLPLPPQPCASIFVQLAAVSPPTDWPPPGQTRDPDFPKTRQAVAGHDDLARVRYFLTTDWRFGALVPDVETANRLVEVVRASLRGAPALVRCEVPMVRHELLFDRTTGALQSPP